MLEVSLISIPLGAAVQRDALGKAKFSFLNDAAFGLRMKSAITGGARARARL